MNDRQTDEEIASHYGPGGPVRAALDWLIAIYRDADLAGAWSLTDPGYRRRLVEAFVQANDEHPFLRGYAVDELTEGLIGGDHALWEGFAEVLLGQLVDAWPDADTTQIAAASRPRPLGPDSELVIFLNTGGKQVMIEGGPQLVPAAQLKMHLVGDSWLVAAFSPPSSGGDVSPALEE